MADDQTQTVDPNDQQAALVQQLLRQTLTGTAAQAPEPPHSGDNRTWGSLLGQALVGGAGPGSTDAQNEQAGLRALQQVGLGMMQGSDYSQARHSLGSIVAGAIGGAQESNAAQIGAQQEYAQKAQEMQLARVKEALPLLTMLQTLQQQKALRGMPSSLGGTNTSIAAVGGGTDPIADLPKDQALAAIIKRESGGQNIPTAILGPDGKPASTASGYYQMLDGTWQEAAALAGIKNAPPRAMMASRADQDAAASALYDKYGYRPWAASAPGSAKTAAAPPTPTAAATPPAASTAPPAPALGKGTPIPAGRPTGPPIITDQPPAGSGAVAGPPGVATVGAPLPPSPTVAGNVNAIIGGMTGAGASPTTLAPGAGSTAPIAPLATQAQVQPLPPPITTPPAAAAPDTGPPTFVYKPNVDLTPAEQRQFEIAKRSYENSIRTALTPEDRQKAEATLQTTVSKQAEILAARRAEDFKQQQADHDKLVEAYHKTNEFNRTQAAERDKAAQALKDQLTIKAAEGEQQRLTGAASTENQYVLDQRKGFATEHDTIRNSLNDFQMLRAFSDAAGTSTPIDNIQIGDKTGRDILMNAGFGTQAQREKWSAQQAFNAVINKSVLAARQGVSMGQLSDRDMNFLQHMTVSQLQNPQTRSDIISYLEQSVFRKNQYMDRVEQLWDGGKGLTWGKARMQAEKEFTPDPNRPETDILPNVPKGFANLPDAARRAFVVNNNLRNGSLVRGEDGRLTRYEVGQ